MKEKQSVISVMQERYRKAGKKLKRQILDERCRLTGYNRAYASHLLCHYKPALKRKAKARRIEFGRPMSHDFTFNISGGNRERKSHFPKAAP